MRPLLYFLLALLSIATLTYTAEGLPLSEADKAMKDLITKVRTEQIWPSRPDRNKLRRDAAHQPPSQSIIFPRLDAFISAAIKQSTYEYANSVLSAVIPAHELEQVRDDPSTFAETLLRGKHWYKGLPADVKEYLAIMGAADKEVKKSQESGKRKGDSNMKRIRGRI